jgi:hypothetical protein
MVCDKAFFQALMALDIVDGLLTPMRGLMASMVGIWPVSVKNASQAS